MADVKTDTLRVTGEFTHANNFQPHINADQLARRNLQEHVVDLTQCRIHDDFGVILPNAGATDNLGLVGGSFGTNAPSLQTEDHQDNGGALLNKGAFTYALPPQYVPGRPVLIRFQAGMISNVADQNATLDIECHSNDEDNSVSADLASAAVSNNMNIIIASVKTIDFTITAAALSPGSVLNVEFSTSVDDDATSAEVIGCITKISVLCDTQG
jgi:hypothetical protein